MKKLILISLMLVAFIGMKAQFTPDTVHVVNPLNNMKEVVTGYTITIYLDILNPDSLAKGDLVVTNVSKIKDSYKIYTKALDDTTFIMSGHSTYNTTDSLTLDTWKEFINGTVIPAKKISDKAYYYEKGYNTERKPLN